MGVCYYLIKNKEMFDLDKGCWSSIFPLTPYYGYKGGSDYFQSILFKVESLFGDVSNLTNKIKSDVYYGHMGCCNNKDDAAPCPQCDSYFLEIARRIFDWGKDVELIMACDLTWELEDDRYSYMITQDRFVPNISLPRTLLCSGECHTKTCPIPKSVKERRGMWCSTLRI